MKRSGDKKIVLRIVYGLVLFVTALSTLEQLSDICNDLFKFDKFLFHLIVVAISLLIAVVEGYTMNGMGFIMSLLKGREPVPAIPPGGKYEYRPLTLDEVPALYQLAKELYGSQYDFTKEGLCSWWRANPLCFFGLFHDGKIVGYFDVFPVGEEGYFHLLSGKDERLLKPLSIAQVNADSCLYIASFVVRPEHIGKVLGFLQKGFNFYIKATRKRNGTRFLHLATVKKAGSGANARGS